MTRYLSSCSAYMSTLQADSLGGYCAQLTFLMQQAEHIRRELRRAIGFARPVTWTVSTVQLRFNDTPTYRMEGACRRPDDGIEWHYMKTVRSTRCGAAWGDDTCVTVHISRITCPDCLTAMGLK